MCDNSVLMRIEDKMAKDYTSKLQKWVEKKKKRTNKQLVAFLAIKEDVQNAIDAGYSIKTIWEHQTDIGKVSCRYETFVKYVKTHINNDKDTQCQNITPGEAEEINQVSTDGQKGFKYSPKANKEDLI